MEERDVNEFLRQRVGIVITRFDSSSLEIELTLDGIAINTTSVDVPAYEIHERATAP